MFKLFKSIFIFIMIIGVSSIFAQSADADYGKSGWLIKEIGVSPRANSFGNYLTAIADDGFSVYDNAAGLAQLYSGNVNLAGGILSLDRMIFNGTFSYPISGIGTLAIGVNYFSLSDIEQRDAEGNFVDKFSDTEVQGTFGYGRELDMLARGLMIGIRVDYLYHKLLDASASGISISPGIIYRFYAIDWLSDLSAGLVIENVYGSVKWSTDTEEQVNMKIKFGLGYRLFNEHLVISGGIKYEKDLPIEFGIGTEYDYRGIVLRIGGGVGNYNGGIGYIFNVYEINYNINVDELGMNHSIALNYKFGGKVEEEIRAKIMNEVINSRAEESYNEGLFHMDNYRYKEAVKSFQLALLWDPGMKKAEKKLEEAKKLISKEQEHKKKFEKKMRKLQLKKGWCPPAKELLKHYYQGIRYYMEGDIKKAIEKWRYVLKCDPNNEKAKLNIRKAELRLKQQKESGATAQ